MSRWHDPSEQAPPQSILATQIGAALTARGFAVDEGVGQSHFRCDLAVRREGEDEYRLGILIDTPAYYEQSDLLERDMMRPRLLRAFGWRLTHVLAKDWHADAAGQTERLMNLLAGEADEALAAIDEASDDAELVKSADDVAALTGTGREFDPADIVSSNEKDPAADAQSSNDSVRSYFELSNDRSQKFWEIILDGDRHTVRFGRIGSAGQSQTKQFADEETARRDCERLIRSKKAKGYQAKDGASS
jgi:predicted DNA-binding WGR domain protein